MERHLWDYTTIQNQQQLVEAIWPLTVHRLGGANTRQNNHSGW